LKALNGALLRLPAVVLATGLSRSTIYRLAGLGEFPRCIKLTERTSAWCASEINQWIEARRAARDRQLAA
jgi:prophage regulatory protein